MNSNNSSEDKRNVIDRYKGWAEDLIREDIKKNTFPFAVMMSQLQGDFNFATVVRSANAFGAQEIFYYGKRHWDKRGALGVYVYSAVKHLANHDDILKLKSKYCFVGLEQTTSSTKLTPSFVWPKNTCIVIGEECNGLTEDILNLCDYVLELSQFGSVRSVNAGVAGSIAMYDYISKYRS